MCGDAIPDASTILKFRHLLEKHKLQEAIFAAVNEHLAGNVLLLRQEMLVDRSAGRHSDLDQECQ